MLADTSQTMPLYVPCVFAAFGVLVWFTSGRRMLRDPRGEFRKIAEIRAKSRVLHPRGGGDVEKEFAQQWRMRWVAAVVSIAWVGGVIWFFVLALTHATP